MRKIVLPALLLVLATACGGSVSNPDSSAAIDSAAAVGRKDAARFNDSAATDMAREATLLNIRHKEAHMRALGYDRAADAYIEVAAQTLPDSITR